MSACVKCKGALKPKALFCTKCGTKVVEPAVAAAPVTPAPAPVAAVATSAVAAPKGGSLGVTRAGLSSFFFSLPHSFADALAQRPPVETASSAPPS